jgi:hypothetical protein
MARTQEEKRARQMQRREERKAARGQSAAKERTSGWANASGRGNANSIGSRDVKAMADKKGISMNDAYAQAGRKNPDANMGGYVAHRAGRDGHSPTIDSIDDYNGSMIANTKQMNREGGPKNHYHRGDIRYLRDQGYSLDEIGKHLSEQQGATFGARATKLLERYKNKIANPETPSKPPGEPTNPNPNPTPIDEVEVPGPNPIPVDGPPSPGQPTNPEPVAPKPPTAPGTQITDSYNPNAEAESSATANQDVNSGNISGDITTGDIDNTGGYIGQIGHTNNSVNINYNNAESNASANASNGGSGGNSDPLNSFLNPKDWSGPDNDPLANLMGGEAYKALNTNAWHRSQSELNGRDAAARASALNDTLTNSREIAAGYGQRASNGTRMMYELARGQWGDTMGDTWRYQPPEWVMPQEPEEIEANTDKYYEDSMDAING